MFDSPARVGLVGLGNLGLPMALHLIERGFEVAAYDTDGTREAQVLDAGGDTGIAAALRCSYLCVVTPDDGPLSDLLGDLEQSSVEIVLLHSTVLPQSVRTLGDRLGRMGISLVDAPVSGGADAARSGSLTILAGGAPGAIDRADRVLSELGEVRHLGGLGSASATKLANQLALFGGLAALYEGLSLTRSFDVPDVEALAAIHASTGDSWAARHLSFFQQLVAEYDAANAPLETRPWRKDVREFEKAARGAGLPASLASLISHSLGDRLEAEARDDSGAAE